MDDEIYVFSTAGILFVSAGFFKTRKEADTEYDRIKLECGKYLEIVKLKKN